MNGWRLALIARGCRPGGGIERYTFELARRLSERHAVTVMTLPGQFSDCGADWLPVPAPRWPLWRSISVFSRRAGEAARRGGFDLVHTQGTDADWGDVVTLHSCHRAGIRSSLKLDPTPVNRWRKALNPAHRVIQKLERKVVNSARALVTVSRRLSRQVKALYPERQTDPLVICPGVEPERLTDAERAQLRALVRQQLGLADADTLFLLVANDPKAKGALRLMRALRLGRNARAFLLIVSSLGHIPELSRAADRLGLAQRVFFRTFGSQVETAYAAADVYAALPEYESFGLAMLEAMAHALPLIIPRHAGVAELIQAGREAVLLPALAKDELVAQVMDYLGSAPELRVQMGAAARYCAWQYSWDDMAVDLEEVYQEVLDQKRLGDAARPAGDE